VGVERVEGLLVLAEGGGADVALVVEVELLPAKADARVGVRRPGQPGLVDLGVVRIGHDRVAVFAVGGTVEVLGAEVRGALELDARG
jgi:hypothetical protein